MVRELLKDIPTGNISRLSGKAWLERHMSAEVRTIATGTNGKNFLLVSSTETRRTRKF